MGIPKPKESLEAAKTEVRSGRYLSGAEDGSVVTSASLTTVPYVYE